MVSEKFLVALGWNSNLADEWSKLARTGLFPARIVGQERDSYRVQSHEHEIQVAILGPQFWKTHRRELGLPVVGDWVVCGAIESSTGGETKFAHLKRSERTLISFLLPRRTLLQRKKPGTEKMNAAASGIETSTLPVAQQIAANIDTIFIAVTADQKIDSVASPFLELLKRYLKISSESGAHSVLLFTKTDLCSDSEKLRKDMLGYFPQVETSFVSSNDERSLEELGRFFQIGATVLIIGASGAGKSTLVNYCTAPRSGEEQLTQDVSRGSKGRHTTTSRRLLFTKWGGLIIDTPGMRDVVLLDEQNSNSTRDAKIETLALGCRFSNCQHHSEPGCAVREAIKKGQLPESVFKQYQLRTESSLANHSVKRKGR